MFDLSAKGFDNCKSSNYNSFSYQNSRNSPTIKQEESNLNQEKLIIRIRDQIQTKIASGARLSDHS